MEHSQELIPIFGMITGILISLGFFAAIFLAIFFSVKARNKERMALIEKGVDISEIYKKKSTGHGFFKFGMILVGIAIGLVFGVLFSRINLLPEVASYFSMILLFGGLGVILANYLIVNKKV